MKKVLFATTALVGSAGVAAADVALSGSAEMGIVGGTGTRVQFHHEIDVKFTLSGETDGGTTFGATIDLDEIGDDCRLSSPFVDSGDLDGDGSTTDMVQVCLNGDNINSRGRTPTRRGGMWSDSGLEELSVFVSGAFGTLTMGDTDGAFDWAMTEVAIGGSLADDHTAHAGYNGNAGFDSTNDGQIARYDYSFGDFSFAASAEIDDNGAAAPGRGSTIYGVGAKYNAAMAGASVGLGVGYQAFTGGSIIGASLDANFDAGFRAILNYSSMTGTAVTNTQHYGIGLGYTVDALTVSANYGNYTRTGAANSNGWGAVVNYDLGGGLQLQAGYGSSSTVGMATTNTYSFGAAMSF